MMTPTMAIIPPKMAKICGFSPSQPQAMRTARIGLIYNKLATSATTYFTVTVQILQKNEGEFRCNQMAELIVSEK